MRFIKFIFHSPRLLYSPRVKLGAWIARVAAGVLLAVPAYAGLAYVVLPMSWKGYQTFAPGAAVRGCSRTAEGIPADPLNVAFVGSREQVVAAMRSAGWEPADPITWRSGIRDATSILFDRPYSSAPVSRHFLFGRPQDLAFERVEGKSPRRRHHVRLWQSADAFWIGAATFDRSVGVSRRTGEVMHHIEPDVDAERATLFADLARGGRLARIEQSEGPHPAGEDLNGGGDRYVTDGRLWTGVLAPDGQGPDSVSVAAGGAPPITNVSPDRQSGSRSR